jgi:hypothetical protein
MLTSNYDTILASSHYAPYNLQCLYLFETINQLFPHYATYIPFCKIISSMQQLNDNEWKVRG